MNKFFLLILISFYLNQLLSMDNQLGQNSYQQQQIALNIYDPIIEDQEIPSSPRDCYLGCFDCFNFYRNRPMLIIEILGGTILILKLFDYFQMSP